MAESRLQRWSRRKSKAARDTVPADRAPVTETEAGSALSPEEQALAVNETLPESELLEKYNLPDPDAIELGTDVTGFMRKEIPEFLRRRALRSLWKSNPVLAVLDGLNDYDEDFTDAASATTAVKTLYQVGRGFDRTPAVDEQPVEQPRSQPPRQEEEVVDSEAADQSEGAADPAVDGHVEPAVSAADVASPGETPPRHRPRMRFDS